MNILVLNYEYPPLGGGAAPVCRDLSVTMAAEGHKVTVVTMGFPGFPAHETLSGVEIIRLKCWRRKMSSCMPWEQLTYIMAVEKFLNYYLKKHSFDVCHTHFIVPTGPSALWVKRHFGIPYIITAHGSDVEGHNRKKWMRLMHLFLRPFWRRIVYGAYTVVSPSESLLKLMRRVEKTDNYCLIPNGLKIEKYRTEKECKERHILVMGRMQQFKNVQTILKAVSVIPADLWMDWVVDILGDGPYRGTLENLADHLMILSRVRFHGWVENGTDDQIMFIKKASVFISASHFENCPMAVLEAAAAGCYPLLSDIEGHRQFFRHMNNADFFFSPDNEKELAAKLKSLLGQDPQTLFKDIDISRYNLSDITSKYVKKLKEAADSRYSEPIHTRGIK